ncbi:hypothetical protein LGMK_05650 [Leuconostoc sp. C2]|uniref:MFS transporter n=2 Tax=Lactobacillaceae TaxID=33958 RepID=A0ABX5SQ66_9LACO|nr:hypothetical protein LGMK_05650 [Leuconostoc sp. C2]QBR48276.1 MFS transporter [Leuconostoc kimchii]
MVNDMNKQHSKFLIPGIIMIGMVLRLPFTSIPPILDTIAKSQHIPVGQLGILTTIPLLSFALFSSFAPQTAKKFGLERTFTFMLMLVVIGSLMRVINTPFLYLGTLLIGIGIAHMNVLLPSVIRMYFPMKIGPMTSLFTFSMMLATALGVSVAAPITALAGWHVFIFILTIILFIALIIWLPNDHYVKKQDKPLVVGVPVKAQSIIWRNKYAWLLLFFCGIQSAMFYVLIAWGPTMAIQAGLSPAVAGVFSGVNSLIGLPFSLFIPTLIARITGRQRQLLMVSLSVVGIIGYLLLLYPTGSFGYWLTVNLLIGMSTASLFPYLLTTFSLKTNTPSQTAQLSGMVQSGGYLIAALGPALFGYAFWFFNSWKPQIITILILFIFMIITIIIIERKDKIL